MLACTSRACQNQRHGMLPLCLQAIFGFLRVCPADFVGAVLSSRTHILPYGLDWDALQHSHSIPQVRSGTIDFALGASPDLDLHTAVKVLEDLCIHGPGVCWHAVGLIGSH